MMVGETLHELQPGGEPLPVHCGAGRVQTQGAAWPCLDVKAGPLAHRHLPAAFEG
jgi:hypothetical protein